MYSPSIENLIKAFSKLPTVGKRTAERFVFYLLQSGKKDVAELTIALKQLIENVKSCEMCWNFTETSPCKICSDQKRNPSLLCVTTTPQDLEVLESTRQFNGRYHLLRGVVKSESQESLERTKIPQLLARIQKEPITEILLALNHNLDGEITMMYLEKKIQSINSEIKITRLARGLPMGSDLQYADEITLKSAIENRR
ncbi:MAG: recombination protein RecR [Candidatus Magasanikbacteria bacterium CG11_big_fil_rev_8_21_14_0_20_39_34]|uniref:Recombination protein RecR n=1 Tax=Candidatus Magasanikbacteria bacterium CG11_big_fil_rev_8_21_14_0_20_39_34 TaxID=1974653 RepID=A0A2H0N5R4_9BACT|nr:MAG: recombination protein RecR [Candidatus Magasanikbacteria bacterium CG11_big_fil_rev_8_21_14_0_20_39_34]